MWRYSLIAGLVATQAYGAPVVAALESKSPAPKASAKREVPKTPEGLDPCTHPLQPTADLPRSPGETIRYLVDVDGLSLGTIDFKIERHGLFEGKPMTEYRSLFKLDGLVSTFVPVSGQAASLVPTARFAPARAMNRYKLSSTNFEENQTFVGNGGQVTSTRVKDGKSNAEERSFGSPVNDFVSGFYLMRRFPKDAKGCAIVYSNQRAYTIWVTPNGRERVKTPVGLREADKFDLTYASDKSKKTYQGKVWLGDGAERLPYQAEIFGQNHLQVRIHTYETGK